MRRVTLAIEIEDKRLRVLLARGSGRRARVEGCSEAIVEPADAAALAKALGTVTAAAGGERPDVYVALGDRRIVPGSVSFPAPLRGADRHRALEREARRAGMFADAEELVIGYVLRHSGGTSAAFDVAPRSVIDDVQAALAALRPRRVWVTSIEAVLAAGLATGEATAILDLRGDRARLVLGGGGVTLAARKFKLPSPVEIDGGARAEALLPLASEINRSFELFAGQGLAAPAKIAVVGAPAAQSAVLDGLAEMVSVPLAAANHRSLALLRRAEDEPLAWVANALLVHDPHAARPYLVEPATRSLARTAAAAAAQVVGLLALGGGIALGNGALGEDSRERAAALTRLERSSDELARTHAARIAERQPPPLVARRRERLAALDRGRVAASHLLALLARGRPEGVQLQRLRWAGGSLEIEGRLAPRAAAPQHALHACSALTASLNAIPTVRAIGLELDEHDAAAPGSARRFVCHASIGKEGDG